MRIGCGCGFWGDSAAGPAQLVRSGRIDVLMLDYLSEITMSLLARARQKRADLGYATDFVTAVMTPLARDIAERGIKVVTNAGGVNPAACRAALMAAFERLGVRLTVATVTGDDVSAELPALRESGVVDLESGRPLPERVVSANVYLGAFPIAHALRQGADIVITGRCVDSALALGPLIAAFDWQPADVDRLAQGSLAGHIIECGTQATGGITTDWREVATGWDDMGYPIVECGADGSFIVTKPPGTGGAVTVSGVAEQITYEVHDPAAYLLPDVICDWSQVQLQDLGDDRVRVCGARGRPPSPDYKASVTYPDGFRCTATVMIVGREAVEKGRHVAAAILGRTRRLLTDAGFSDYRATSVEVLGSEASYGPHSMATATREVILKIAVSHEREEALELFAREIFPAATSMAQGLTGFAGGRPSVQPVVRLASCLVPKLSVEVSVEVNGRVEVLPPTAAQTVARAPAPEAHAKSASLGSSRVAEVVPLIRLATGRSGDKGDTANIGVIARRPEFVNVLASELTAERVAAWFAHLIDGPVERYDWPGLNAWNFVLRRALGGGGIASLRYDPQGKSYAQILMDFPVGVPSEWLAPGGLLA